MNNRKNIFSAVRGGAAELLISLFFFLSLFLYYLIVIHPVLYFTAQDPVFFFEKHFFFSFPSYPGGLLDWASALLSQLYFFPFAGAAVLAFVDVAFVFFFRLFLKKTAGDISTAWSFPPVLLLLLSHNSYGHSIAIDLAALAATIFAVLLVGLSGSLKRLLLYIFAGALLFYTAGGASFLLLSLLLFIFHLLKEKNISLSFVYLFAGVVYPWAAAAFLFPVTLKEAWLLPLTQADKNIFSLLFFAAIPLTVLFLFWYKSWNFSLKNKMAVAIFSIMMFLLTFTIPFLSFDKRTKTFWHINYSAQLGNWEDVLETYEKSPSVSPQIALQVNRALTHLDKMGDDFFRYNQYSDKGVFFFPQDSELSSPLIFSDIFFDLSHFNEAKHWAYEALSVKGETGWILQRLAITHLLDGDTKLAEKYLDKLEKTIPFKGWAQQHKKFLYDRTLLANDPTLGPMLAMKIEKDFLTFVYNPQNALLSLLQQRPDNKIAFYYYMTDLLLSKELGRFVQELKKFDRFDFDPLPRHFQEALLFYASQRPKEKIDISNFKMSLGTLKRFRNFNVEYVNYGKDKERAFKTLRKDFGDSYWYYLIFHKKTGSA